MFTLLLMLSIALAIGHSTNLIAPDSNVIVVRGNTDRPVYQQMTLAVEDYFPNSGILNDDGIVSTFPRKSTSDSARPYPMRRMDTGVTSLVGAENGEKPGGYILVIDGAALSVVSCLLYIYLVSLYRLSNVWALM